MNRREGAEEGPWTLLAAQVTCNDLHGERLTRAGLADNKERKFVDDEHNADKEDLGERGVHRDALLILHVASKQPATTTM